MVDGVPDVEFKITTPKIENSLACFLNIVKINSPIAVEFSVDVVGCLIEHKRAFCFSQVYFFV